MNFNRLLNLIGFSGKAHRGSPVSGRVMTPECRMPVRLSKLHARPISAHTYPSKPPPPTLTKPQQEELEAALSLSGIAIANRYWKVVRRFVSDRVGVSLSRSGSLNYQHRLGYAFKRPRRGPRRVGFGRNT